MKVTYPLKQSVDIKEVKEILKPFGGRCAKVLADTLEYQIKEEDEQNALQALKDKGLV